MSFSQQTGRMEALLTFWAIPPGSGARPDIMETDQHWKERNNEGERESRMKSIPYA